MKERPVIAVVGTGAMGAYYGGRLAQHGHDVHFLLRGDFDAVRQRGWTIRSCDGDFTIPADQVRAYNDPSKMPRADLVLVTLKTTANDQFEPLIRRWSKTTRRSSPSRTAWGTRSNWPSCSERKRSSAARRSSASTGSSRASSSTSATG